MQIADPISSMSGVVNQYFWSLLGLCSFTALLIIGLLIIFSIKYRHRLGHKQSQTTQQRRIIIEVIWIGLPLVTFLILFVWASKIYFMQMTVPANSLQIYAVAQQWMWKFQHVEGQREINQLHVPINRPIAITLISQDVIHSFFVPDFRIKMDVVPGRYTQTWFEAKKPGKYRIFCSQYCGTWHSRMRGEVIAMIPKDYQEWLSVDRSQRMAFKGKNLVEQHGCFQCHKSDSGIPSPSLNNLFRRQVHLSNGAVITADEAYIRDSILDPGRQIVQGYANVMPTYKHQLSEEDITNIIEYLEFLDTNYGKPE